MDTTHNGGKNTVTFKKTARRGYSRSLLTLSSGKSQYWKHMDGMWGACWADGRAPSTDTSQRGGAAAQPSGSPEWLSSSPYPSHPTEETQSCFFKHYRKLMTIENRKSSTLPYGLAFSPPTDEAMGVRCSSGSSQGQGLWMIWASKATRDSYRDLHKRFNANYLKILTYTGKWFQREICSLVKLSICHCGAWVCGF